MINLSRKFNTKWYFETHSLQNAQEEIAGSREYDYYCLLWIWSVPRFSNNLNADFIQSKYYEKYGKERYYKRINRVRKWFGLDSYK